MRDALLVPVADPALPDAERSSSGGREEEELRTAWSRASIPHWRQQSVPHSGLSAPDRPNFLRREPASEIGAGNFGVTEIAVGRTEMDGAAGTGRA